MNRDFRDLLAVFNVHGVEYLAAGAHMESQLTKSAEKMTMHILLGIFLTISVCVVGMAYAAGDLNDSVKTALNTQKLISVATQRAHGEWGRAAPIWFMYDGEAVYFITAPKSYKARRIGKGSPVQVWLDEKTGPAFTGETQIVTDTASLDRINAAYKRKYWTAWLTYWAMPLAGRVEAGKMVAVQVIPNTE